MDTLRNALDRFERSLKIANQALFDRLNHGLSRPVIKRSLGELTSEINPELIELYHWRNGIEDTHTPSGKIWFPGCYVFNSLQYSIDDYKLDSTYNLNGSTLFPIFKDDYLLIEISKENNPVYYYCPSLQILEPKSIYDSMYHLFNTMAILLETRVCYYDSEGVLQFEYEPYNSTCRGLNPNSEYWLL